MEKYPANPTPQGPPGVAGYNRALVSSLDTPDSSDVSVRKMRQYEQISFTSAAQYSGGAHYCWEYHERV